MAALSEWLQLMLAEIARKNDDLERARAEEAQRAAEKHASSSPPSSNVTSVQEARAARRNN
jgi:F0F1-type ATP synthase epsilon subunit